MSFSEVVVAILLTAGVLVELLSCVGVLVMSSAFDRLHYVGPAATLGPVLLAAAVLVRHSSAQACIKAVVLVVLLLIISPVLTHVTARAARIRQTGRLDVVDATREKDA